MLWRIEVIPLALNVFIAAYHTYHFNAPGQILYWWGAVLVTVGLLFMKG